MEPANPKGNGTDSPSSSMGKETNPAHSPYGERRRRIALEMARRGVTILALEDAEHLREPSVRYLSGHPQDALLFLHVDGRAALVPWDVPLAEQHAKVPEILPYNNFHRQFTEAIRGVLDHWGISPHQPFALEVGSREPYATVIELEQALRKEYPGGELLCLKEGIPSFIEECRLVKDAVELSLMEQAARITNEVLDSLETLLREERPIPETEVALFVEMEGRKRGAEGTSFSTIAAGPSRSFAIHAFPTFGPGLFKDPGSPGLSILDFGLYYQGYTSDVTITLATGKLTERMKFLLSLVEEGYQKALSLCRPGVGTWEIASAVQALFSRQGLSMPHSLGHGIGLAVHERPFFRSPEQGGAILEPGMVLTIEPGLYEAGTGGVRLENDILITETGHRVLTRARFLYG